MDVQVAETGPCSRTLTIKIPATRVQEHLDEMYQSASQQVQMKGFRKGKIPRSMIEKRFGTEILAEAKESLINKSFQDACQEHELAMVGSPRLEGIDQEPIDSSKEFEFQVHLDVRPMVELGDVRGIEVVGPNTEVTDEDLENALNQVAEQRKSLQSVDEPVAGGDFVKVDLTFHNDAGEEIQKREGVQLNTQIPVAGTDPQQFAERLEGREKGQQLEMELTFPDSFEKPEARGQKGKVEISINDVLRVVPPAIDDEMAKSFDFDSLDALKEDMRQRIQEEKVRAEKARVEMDIIQAILNENPFSIPESLVEDEKKQQLKNYAGRLEERGTDKEEIEKQLKDVDEEAGQEAERRVRLYFLLDAIAKKEKIFVTETDMTARMREVAEEHNVPLASVQEHFTNNDFRAELRMSILELKIRDFLREKAKITDN